MKKETIKTIINTICTILSAIAAAICSSCTVTDHGDKVLSMVSSLPL